MCERSGTDGTYTYAWRNASASEAGSGRTCTANNYDKFFSKVDSVFYNEVCEQSGTSYAWRTANAAEKKYLKTCSKFTYDSGVLANAYQYGYVCDASLNYAWREVYGTNEKNTVLAASSHMKFTEREAKS